MQLPTKWVNGDYWLCLHCADEYDLTYVGTYDKNHGNYSFIENASINDDFLIVYYFTTSQTSLYIEGMETLKMPGLIFTPENCREKLKKYMAFI